MFNIILKHIFSFNTNVAILVGLGYYIKWHRVSREIQIFFFSWSGRLLNSRLKFWQGLVSSEDSLPGLWERPSNWEKKREVRQKKESRRVISSIKLRSHPSEFLTLSSAYAAAAHSSRDFWGLNESRS